MSLREWLAKNHIVAPVAAVIVLGIALGVVVMQMRSGLPRAGEQTPVYFWDEEANEPFVAQSGRTPPEAPSGGRGVLAHLYSCGECEPDQWFGYLTTYTEEYNELLERQQAGEFDDMADSELTQLFAGHHLVRSLEGGQWVLHDSREGERIRSEHRDRCGPGAMPRPCRP